MSDLKAATASTIKWNTIDRLSSQLVFAAVGIVLANRLGREDFGLVGVLAIFQAFAIVFVDSGFGAALLRLKEATKEDYSTVFWFNLLVSVSLYILLWFLTPGIAALFHGDARLIPLSKVMFISFILNGLGIVQTNRMMKRMDVRPLAISNFIGLTLGGGLGVWLAISGAGAWALVWQTVAQAGIRTFCLWVVGGWFPSLIFSRQSFSRIWRVGLGVFSSSFLNTLFLHIYSFVIGVGGSVPQLGLYTQADKWSKMGSAALSQTMTSSFVPLLARVQDDRETFGRYVLRINRFTAFVTFPTMIGFAVLGAPLFHFLFGDKWNDAILLFQILSIRGIPIVLVSVMTNYLLALGYARSLVVVEVIKDTLTIAAILATVWERDLTLLVWGQFWASVVTWMLVLLLVSRKTGWSLPFMLRGNLPFLIAVAVAAVAALVALAVEPFIFGDPSSPLPSLFSGPFSPNLHGLAGLIAGGVCGGGIYLLILTLSGSHEPAEALGYLLKKRKNRE